MPHPYQFTIKVPFENSEHANIAKNSLSPDPILKLDEIETNYAVDASSLVCTFNGISNRVIRVAISNVLDNVKTIIETIEEFDGKKDVVFV